MPQASLGGAEQHLWQTELRQTERTCTNETLVKDKQHGRFAKVSVVNDETVRLFNA